MQPNFNSLFANLPDESRIWLYLADRPLEKNEEEWLNAELELFLNSWAAHNNKLRCDGIILFSQYIVLVVDEVFVKASGCSIDSSTHFMKKAGAALNIDFFNRLYVLQQEGGVWVRRPYDLAKTETFLTPFIQTLGDLRSQWPILH
jgi:hypothetical protein